MRLNRDRVAQLWDLMTERQKVYHRRFVEKRPWPWTLDPVLRDWKFPNVYRHLDTGTIYLREDLLPRLEPGQILLNMVIYRHFNTVHTAERILPVKGPLPTNLHLSLEGVTPYTHAYRTSPFMTLGGKTQLENSQIASYAWAQKLPGVERHLESYTMLDVVQDLQSLPGIGYFVAYVIACDLTYTDLVDYDENQDTFPHSGSLAALDWLKGHNQTMMHAKLAKGVIFQLWEQSYNELNRRGFPFLKDGDDRDVPLTVRGIEDGLCELMRYRKLKFGASTGRRYYQTRELPL